MALNSMSFITESLNSQRLVVVVLETHSQNENTLAHDPIYESFPCFIVCTIKMSLSSTNPAIWLMTRSKRNEHEWCRLHLCFMISVTTDIISTKIVLFVIKKAGCNIKKFSQVAFGGLMKIDLPLKSYDR